MIKTLPNPATDLLNRACSCLMLSMPQVFEQSMFLFFPWAGLVGLLFDENIFTLPFDENRLEPCFLTKTFLLSHENIFTLPFDENRLEPCFLTKMLICTTGIVYNISFLNIARFLYIFQTIISVSVLWKIDHHVDRREKDFSKKEHYLL